MDMKVPELEIDFDSDAWKVIAAHAQKQLDDLRLKNDSTSLDALATAVTRGRIAVWKDLLDMPAKRRKAEEKAQSGQDFSGY